VSKTQTLTEALVRHGYSHRAPTNPNHNGRVILNGCGTAIGRVSADEGWVWIAQGCPLDVNGFVDADAIAESLMEREEERRQDIHTEGRWEAGLTW
jgi:hypothetical protein